MDDLPFSTMSQLLWALKTSLKDLFQFLLNKFPFNKEMYMLSKRLSTEENSQSSTTWTDLQYTQKLNYSSRGCFAYEWNLFLHLKRNTHQPPQFSTSGQGREETECPYVPYLPEPQFPQVLKSYFSSIFIVILQGIVAPLLKILFECIYLTTEETIYSLSSGKYPLT